MDYSVLPIYLLAVSSVCMAMKNTVSVSNVLQTSSTGAEMLGREHRVRHGVLEDDSPFTETKKVKSCCLNGGLCIMNAFCHCKNSFYGRRCEHRQRQRSCGTIGHGTWMAVACHMCHCFDGHMTCKTSVIPGCESMPYAEGRETEPDYNVGFDKKVEDYDRFYDVTEDDTALKSASSTLQLQNNVILVTVAIVTSLLRKSGS